MRIEKECQITYTIFCETPKDAAKVQGFLDKNKFDVMGEKSVNKKKKIIKSCKKHLVEKNEINSNLKIMPGEKTCDQCGSKYSPRSNRQQYCSEQCKVDHLKEKYG